MRGSPQKKSLAREHTPRSSNLNLPWLTARLGLQLRSLVFCPGYAGPWRKCGARSTMSTFFCDRFGKSKQHPTLVKSAKEKEGQAAASLLLAFGHVPRKSGSRQPPAGRTCVTCAVFSGGVGGGLSAVQGLRDDPLWVQWRHFGGQTQLGSRFRESVQQFLMPRSLECS